ncbi:hypothetical protein OA77_30435 [Pseudomonas coronafaciens]|nr:hypothetical protein OA77_30435 [Pseudomonas coronafaciens]
MICLFRVDDVKYNQGSTARLLEAPLKLRMLDENGNHHALSIGFPSIEVTDSRNTLLINVI